MVDSTTATAKEYLDKFNKENIKKRFNYDVPYTAKQILKLELYKVR